MAADFIPVEEVRRILTVHLDVAEKVAKDFFKEEWVDEPEEITLLGDLEGAQGLEEGLEEVGGKEEPNPVGVGEDHTTLAKIK